MFAGTDMFIICIFNKCLLLKIKKYILIITILLSLFFVSLAHLQEFQKDNVNIQSSGLHSHVISDLTKHLKVQLNSSLKLMNGYSYGIIGIPVEFYAHVLFGSGVYEFHWFVNSVPVKNLSSSNNLSIFMWTFTNTSNFGGGYYNYVNVTVTDSQNSVASATYYVTFSYEPEIFLTVSGPSETDRPIKTNITVTDWLDVSALNLSIFVNDHRIYNVTTEGWGQGFPISIPYNFDKVGVYNVSVIAYDGAGQRIIAYHTIIIIPKDVYYWNQFKMHLEQNLQPQSLIFVSIIGLFVADVVKSLSNKGN